MKWRVLLWTCRNRHSFRSCWERTIGLLRLGIYILLSSPVSFVIVRLLTFRLCSVRLVVVIRGPLLLTSSNRGGHWKVPCLLPVALSGLNLTLAVLVCLVRQWAKC